MPGNELDERLHNFFAQDNSLQGQHHSQAVEGNWPVLNSNFWAGSQSQVDLLNSNNRNYISANSDVDRGEGSNPLHVTHGLNFTHPNLRPDFAKNQSLSEQPNSNGLMYGNQFHQTRQNETNFLAVDRDSDQGHIFTSRGLSFHELQQRSGPNLQTKAPVRLESSGSPFTFDLFGGQQHINHQQSSSPQPLQRQQSGTNNMQQLQQQLMIKKMQELQRQQELQQRDLRQHNLINEATPFVKQTSGHSTLVNGTPNSDTPQHPWAAEHGMNWLNHGSPTTMHGSPSGHGFQPNFGQSQRLTDPVPQQVDHSLYGVPVSSSRGLPVKQYSQMVPGRSSMPQMQVSGNYLQGNQDNLLPDRVGVQNEYSVSRHKLQNENMFGLASGQSLNTGMRNMVGLQQVNSIPGNGLQQDFYERQEVAVRPETSREKPTMQVASPQNEVGLDPAEEKILFGSDDNIWAAFGKEPHMSGEAGKSFDNDGLSSSLPSIHSGSWSALMQSAVAETSSSDAVPQQELSSLNFHKNNGPSGDQAHSMHNDRWKRETYLDNRNMRISSAPFPPSDDINAANVTGLSQLGQKFQNEPDRNLQNEMSQRFFQTLEESDNRSHSGPAQDLVAKRSQMYGDSSQHPHQAATSAKTNSSTWVPGQAAARSQLVDWNALATVPHGGDRVAITQEAEKLHQSSQNGQVRVNQGEVVHGSSSWKSNSVPSSAFELGGVNSRIHSYQKNQGILSLNDASVAKVSNARINDETSSFVQSNYLINQWKNAHPPARSKDGGSLGRQMNQATGTNQGLDSMNSRQKGDVSRIELENCDGKENSSDSHHSSISQRASGGIREGGFSDMSDSQSLPSRKQRSTNQLSRKVSAPHKFQYHPLGNVDGDVEPNYGLKQHTLGESMFEQKAHFGQSKIFGQVPRNSLAIEKGESSEPHRGTKAADEESSHGHFSGHEPNVPVPFSPPIDAHHSNNASSSSQNMLELLHKVDQSRNHGAMMQFNSSDSKSSSQPPEAESFDGFGHLQRTHSFVSQGFGLQLGPPSQKLQNLDHPFSSQNGQGTFNSVNSTGGAAGMRDKGQQVVASHSVQPLPSPEETQVEFSLSRSRAPGHGGNASSLYKIPENSTSATHAGDPHSRGYVQNQQIARPSGQRPMRHQIDSNDNVSYFAQKRSADTLLPDASGSFRQDNLATSGGMYRPSDIQVNVPTASISSGDHEQTPRHFAMPGIGRQGNSAHMLHNMRTNVPALQHNMGVQFQPMSSRILDSAIVESNSALMMQGYVNSQGVSGEEQKSKESSSQLIAPEDTDVVPKMKNSVGKASSLETHSDDSPANSASTQKDIEAFGRSLKPNSYSQQNYSLQNQMEALKDGEIDSSNRVSKRMRGLDNVANAHQAALDAGQNNEHNAAAVDSLDPSSIVQIEDSKILGFSRPPDILQRKTSQQGIGVSNDSSGLSRDVSQGFSHSDYMTSIRTVHPQVSPQMAPSWFSQFGTSKNEQMLQIHDAHKVTQLRPGDPPFTPVMVSSAMDMLNQEEKGTAAPVEACELNSSHQNSTSLANGHFTSPLSPQMDVTSQHLVASMPKKRKTATSELHPWHREILEGSLGPWTLSVASEDWNEAANCLAEKVDDDVELLEDVPPVVRSRRRLTLTTHLMQQLLRPAPTDVLRVDASSSCELIAYSVSRIALGDACSMASRTSNLDIPCDSMNILLMKGKSTDRNGGGCRSKTTEELVERARNLENSFLRLDKSASILDLRVEYQDLEKFSIINRFARFHGRGQTDNAETTSSDVNASAHRPTPQRYVTALPMPGTISDRVQCLSL